jgi:hypothetical protein
MYRLIHFECENIIGIYNGLGRKHFELDLRPHRDKSVFIFLGTNAKGKSTALSLIHPFDGTTDGRSKFVREGKEGYKELVYENQDDPNEVIRVRHVYIPTKTSHSTKSFLFKEYYGETIDLNPNSLVSSFKEAIEKLFGITEDFMKLAAQNDQMVSLVQMTGASRKDHIYNFIPKADDPVAFRKTITRKYSTVKAYLSSIIDKLGRMEDEVTVAERLRAIERDTNELVEKRDKHIGKLNQHKAELKTIDPEGELSDRYKMIRNTLGELNTRQDKLKAKVDRVLYERGLEIPSMVDLEKLILAVGSEKAILKEKLIGLRSSIQSHKNLRNTIYDSIEEKESLIRQLAGDRSKDDLVELLKDYQDKLDSYDSRSKDLKAKVSADDLVRGLDVLSHLRTFMEDVIVHSETEDDIKEACQSAFSVNFESRYRDTEAALEEIDKKISELDLNIAKLNGYEHLKDTLDKRPADCVIDDCAFLQDYHKWVIIEEKINEFHAQMADLNASYKKLHREMEEIATVQKLKVKVESMLTFYRSNLTLLSRLPFNEKYSNEDRLLRTLMLEDRLKGVDDHFYDMIEILQDKEEIDEVRNVKLPLLQRELQSLVDNDNLVQSLRNELGRMKLKHHEEVVRIQAESGEEAETESRISDLADKEEMLVDMRDRMEEMDKNKEEIIALSHDFDKVKDASQRISELKDEIYEREQKLKSVDARLKPLTAERDSYKYQEQKIAEYKKEKKTLEDNMRILELIQKAMSTTKGMPVSILNMYVEDIRRSANLLLSETFDGSLYLDTFNITDKEFTIPYQHNGDKGADISIASSSERAFISTCLSMAVMEPIMANYGILNYDEVDAGFSEQNKALFCTILMKQMKRIGINQVFFITHSREYYEPYDVCYILFPGHTLKESSGKDYIKVY